MSSVLHRAVIGEWNAAIDHRRPANEGIGKTRNYAEYGACRETDGTGRMQQHTDTRHQFVNYCIQNSHVSHVRKDSEGIFFWGGEGTIFT